MKATTWTLIIAVLSLVVSVLSLVLGVGRARWKDRMATPRAQLDLLRVEKKSGVESEVRLLITNQGPAVMRQVEVQVFDADGMSLEMGDPDVSALWPRMPVQELYPGQPLFLTINRSLATRDPRQSLIRWRDGRRGQRSCMIPLSYNRV